MHLANRAIGAFLFAIALTSPLNAELALSVSEAESSGQSVPPISAFVETEAAAEPAAGAMLDGLPEPDKSYWSEKRINDYAIARRDANADDVPEGVMHLPSINVEFPVYSGTAEKYLTLGAGRVEGTAPLGTPGNSGIASHRDGFFRGLKDVKVGDPIHIRTMSGQQEFRIVELFIVNPEDAYVLYPTEEDAITLVTCYPFYHVGHAPQRYIVRAHRTGD